MRGTSVRLHTKATRPASRSHARRMRTDIQNAIGARVKYLRALAEVTLVHCRDFWLSCTLPLWGCDHGSRVRCHCARYWPEGVYPLRLALGRRQEGTQGLWSEARSFHCFRTLHRSICRCFIWTGTHTMVETLLLLISHRCALVMEHPLHLNRWHRVNRGASATKQRPVCQCAPQRAA